MASKTITIESKRESTRALSVVLGYMCIALIVTALVCLGFSLYFSKILVDGMNNYNATGDIAQYEHASNVVFGSLIGGVIALFIMSFVTSFIIGRSKKGAWIPYLIYAALMGFTLSPVVMWIDSATIATAFGITAAVFLVLFLIGYFSKANLSILGLIGLGILFSVLFVPLPLLIIYLLVPGALGVWDFVASIACSLYMLIMVAVEANRMNREIRGGVFTNSMALYYAFSFYTDFIYIFLRVLMILASSKSRNN